MLFENLKIRYKKLLIIILPLLVVMMVTAFFAYSSIATSLGANKAAKEAKTYDIESMDYHLRGNATDYQVELFKELEKAIDSNDDLKIAECVVKNYVTDVYTWTNKQGKWDIGGMSFVYSKQNNAIYYNIKDEVYNLYEKTKKEYGDDSLIEVSDVEITTSYKIDELYEVDGSQYESYYVGCKMTLDSKVDKISGLFTHNGYFTVIKNTDKNGKFEIVVSYGD